MVGIDPNLFQVTIKNKMNERTEFRENRTEGMYDNIFTIVTRFMGGLLPHFWRHVTATLKIFFQNFFHQDLGEEKSVILLIDFS